LYLSGLEIIGFKSFPLKTTLEFANGITGVVGPNGCGKTNVLDAIRWVLGEQRISILRGGKMEDVIFSGTRELKPIGMAEVSLHIVNDNRALAVEYRNVTVTRRLHRSGESEYLLNRVQCRLKDITDMFADTGMGAHAYSAIELDMVESILSDKADQRRVLFEEAAGITRYKERKRAALRKLEATDHDLLRLSDILSEVSTQVGSLSRQMKKAERYKYYEDRVKTVGLVLLKEKYRRLSQHLRQVRDERRVSQIKLAEVSGEIDRWELAREDYAGKALELSEEIKQVRVQSEEISANCYRLEREISVTEEKINSADAANRDDLKEIDSMKVKVGQLGREKESLQSQLASARVAFDEAQRQLTELESQLTGRIAQLDEERKSGQVYQRDLFEIEGKKNLFDQNRRHLETQFAEADAQLEEARLKLADLQPTLAATVASVTDIDVKQQTVAEEIGQSELQISETEETVSHLENAISELAARVAEHRLDVRSLNAQIELHERMIAHYEGYGSGVTAIFANREQLPGVIDTAANLLQAEDQYLQTIEMALGETAEYIVVKDRAAANNAVAFLQANNLGKATFVIKSELDQWQRDNKLARPGGFGGNIVRASEVVSATPEYQRLAELLLGDALIVADREAAERLLDLGQGEFRVVTQDGHYYQSKVLHQGGSARPVALLGRESELSRLKQRLESCQTGLVTFDGELARLQSERDQQQEHLAQLTQQLEQQRWSQTNLQLESTRHTLQRQQLEEQQRETSVEIARLEERLHDFGSQLAKLVDDSTRLQDDSDGKQQTLQAHTANLAAIEQEVAKVSREQEELRLRVIKLQTERNSLEGNLLRVEELTHELATQSETRQHACEQRVNDIDYQRLALVELRDQLQESSKDRESLRQQEMQLMSRQAEISDKQTEFDQLLKASRKNRDLVTEGSQQLLVSETEANSKFEDVVTQLRESFGISADELTVPEPLAEETFHELEAELAECRGKQQQLGLVNMLALEEYEKEAERERFLSQQIGDLTRAKDDLKTTITRINTTARNMFLETFGQVRANFQRVFSDLFQGGEADLRMEDENDPLESPILISARPRGKRLLNISQLSGGEKALTAISLLFAIYLVKPSPFCILDEVDAPLDDANVNRFLKMIRHFAQKTQFILITHNKRTMEQCDRLYGVTMQQPGVSQIVSVDFAAMGKPIEMEELTFSEAETQPEGLPVIEEQARTAKTVDMVAKEAETEVVAEGETETEVPVVAVAEEDEYDDDDDDEDDEDDD
jgi:chromosome segregation protein